MPDERANMEAATLEAPVTEEPKADEQPTETGEIVEQPPVDHTAELNRLAAMRKLGEEIQRRDRECDMQESEVATAEAALKSERATLNGMLSVLEDLHQDLANLAAGGFVGKLDFDGAEKPVGEEPAPASDPEAWRAIPLSETGIPAKIVQTLADAGLNTMGEMSDFMARGRLTDIKGIGKGKAEQIENTLADYWVRHPEYTPNAEPAPAPDAAEADTQTEPEESPE